MTIHQFPPVDYALPDGTLALGGDLEVETLKNAYRSGIFPWPTDFFPLRWVAPPERAILEFKDFKIPKRFQRELRKRNFHYKVDQNFKAVIRACSEGKTRKTEGTWITPEMIEAFVQFHKAGYAHSFECYNPKGELVGGLYGVGIGSMFAGESMFFLESGASKAALIFTVHFLKERGAKWMDVQQLTPLSESFGAKEVSRRVFMTKLKQAVKGSAIFPIPNQTKKRPSI